MKSSLWQMWMSGSITNILNGWFFTWTFLTKSLIHIHQNEAIPVDTAEKIVRHEQAWKTSGGNDWWLIPRQKMIIPRILMPLLLFFQKVPRIAIVRLKTQLRLWQKTWHVFLALSNSLVVSLLYVELQTFPSLCRIFQNQFVHMQICICYTYSDGKQSIFYHRNLSHSHIQSSLQVVQWCHSLLHFHCVGY